VQLRLRPRPSVFWWAARLPSRATSPVNRLAVWYFHAKDDATVDIAGGRAMFKAMREVGGTPIYTR
jgi:hypothetical protein